MQAEDKFFAHLYWSSARVSFWKQISSHNDMRQNMMDRVRLQTTHRGSSFISPRGDKVDPSMGCGWISSVIELETNDLVATSIFGRTSVNSTSKKISVGNDAQAPRHTSHECKHWCSSHDICLRRNLISDELSESPQLITNTFYHLQSC